jgi:hypothetical protein
MLKVSYVFYPFGKKEFAEEDVIYFNSDREYDYWKLDRQHDKTWRNHEIINKEWV